MTWKANKIPALSELEHLSITAIRKTGARSIWIEAVGRVFHYDGRQLWEHEVAWKSKSVIPRKRVLDFYELPNGSAYIISESEGVYHKDREDTRFLPLENKLLDLMPYKNMKARVFSNHSSVIAEIDGDAFLIQLDKHSVTPIPLTINGKHQHIDFIFPLLDEQHYLLTDENKLLHVKHVDGILSLHTSFDCDFGDSPIEHALSINRKELLLVNKRSQFMTLSLIDDSCIVRHEDSSFFSSLASVDIKDMLLLSDGHTLALATDAGLMIATNDELKVFSRKNTVLPTDEMVSLAEIYPGVMWIGSFLGPIELERTGIEVTRQLGDDNNPSVISIDSSTVGVFVATNEAIYEEDRTSSRRTFRKTDSPTNTAGISVIYVDDDMLWIGYQDGKYAFKKHGRSFSVCDNRDDSTELISPVSGIAPLPHLNGSLVVSRLNGTISLAESCDEYIVDWGSDKAARPTAIYALLSDSSGLWVFGERGAYRLELQSDLGIVDKKILGRVQLHHLGAWTASSNQRERLITTPQGYISYIDGDKTFRELNPLSNDTVFAIENDQSNRIWFGTQRGLWLLDKTSGRISQEFATDTSQISLDYGASHMSVDGRIFFGGTGGLLVIDDPDYGIRQEPPRIVLTSVRLGSSRFHVGTHDEMFKLHLESSHEPLSLSLQKAALKDPWLSSVEYILEGHDSSWRFDSNRDSITYSNLSPGDYTFRARGTDSAGNRTINELAISISVEKPAWQTWWAYIFYVAALLQLGSLLKKAYDRHLVAQTRLRFADEQASAYSRLEDDYQEQLEANERLLRYQSPAAQELLNIVEVVLEALEDGNGASKQKSSAVLRDITRALRDLEKQARRSVLLQQCDIHDVISEIAARAAQSAPYGQIDILNDAPAALVRLEDARFVTIIACELLRSTLDDRDYAEASAPLVVIRVDVLPVSDSGSARYLVNVKDNALPLGVDAAADALPLCRHLTESLGGQISETYELGNGVGVLLELRQHS